MRETNKLWLNLPTIQAKTSSNASIIFNIILTYIYLNIFQKRHNCAVFGKTLFNLIKTIPRICFDTK